MTPTITEGEVEFHEPQTGETYRTWYKVVGSLDDPSSIPLVTLHGGPGACHDYLLSFADLAASHAIPVVFYDQIGNGRSTHLSEKDGDESFWTESLFQAELNNLLSHLNLVHRPIDLYGQSWGGMLALGYAASTPPNLRRLIISNGLASMDGWRAGVERLRRELPEEVQRVLDRCEAAKDFTSPDYEAAVEVFYKRHISLTRPWPPKEVQAALDWLDRDPTTYGTMWGPSEFHITGTLRNWTSIPVLYRIRAPTLLINGAQDEAQDEAMRPLFEHIPKAKWVVLENAAHFSHVDQRDRYFAHVTAFLTA